MISYLIMPYAKPKKKDRNLQQEQTIFGKFKTALKLGNLRGKDGVFNQITKTVANLQKINTLFSVQALTEAIKDKKITNKFALDYLFNCLARQLGFVKITMGYNSLQAMKMALSNGTINILLFLSNLASACSLCEKDDELANIDKNKVLFIDLIEQLNFSRSQSVSRRRVANGSVLNDFMSLENKTMSLNCYFVEGTYYTKKEFEEKINWIIDSKQVLKFVNGDEQIKNVVITSYNPTNSTYKNGFSYSLGLEQIKRGSFTRKKIMIETEKQNNGMYINSNVIEQTKKEKLQVEQTIGKWNKLKVVNFD